ncbi:attractin-like protein 1 isoform X2 [Ciona intestinalis]
MFGNAVKIVVLLMQYIIIAESVYALNKNTNPCNGNGQYVDGKCQCNDGFSGEVCESCIGRFVLTDNSGTISSGADMVHFSNCMGIIQPKNITNKSIYIQFVYVENSCSCDFLNVYDGYSVHDPFLATFHGAVDPIQLPAVVSSTGSVVLQFNNDDMPFLNKGYTIYYWLDDYPPSDTEDVGSGDEPGDNTTCIENWCMHKWPELLKQGRASSAVQSLNGMLYIHGGYLFTLASEQKDFMRMNMTSFEWDVITISNNSYTPDTRYDHTMVVWQENLYIYGGSLSSHIITNEMWMYNTTISTWKKIIANKTFDFEIPSLKGHTAHSVKLKNGRDVILVFFGYHPGWKFSPFVFEFDFINNLWSKVPTTGAMPIGRYGHASVHDQDTNNVYVHGGSNDNIYYHLYVYNADAMLWKILPHSPKVRYLHSMVMLGRSLYVYGGLSDAAHCQCSTLTTVRYSIDDKIWLNVEENELASARFGHSAFGHGNRTMAIYGGYDGTMRNEIITLQDANSDEICGNLNITQCEMSKVCDFDGHNCTYNVDCVSICNAATTCSDCFSTICDCCFDFGTCTFTKNSSCLTNFTNCNIEEEFCSELKECSLCNEAGCSWQGNNCRVKIDNTTTSDCLMPCESFTSCMECSDSQRCQWCDTTNTCIPHGTSNIYFPYGTCTHFITTTSQCKDDPCTKYQSCDDCFQDDGCGWQDLGGNNGYGSCLSGSTIGPVDASLSSDNWHFLECPACQCNGHSTCSPDQPDVCTECTGGTNGFKCSLCDGLFYGDPSNGRNCTACECNGHAEECQSDGECVCNVKGVVGSNCERCGSVSGYQGDAQNDTCFFEMKVLVEYSFPISYEDSKFNLVCCPTLSYDITVNVETIYGQPINITMTTNTTNSHENETVVAFFSNVSSASVRFPQKEYHFGNHNDLRCVRIYLSDIQHLQNMPDATLLLKASVIQNSTSIGLLIAIFLLCFTSLVLITSIIYKANRIIMSRRRRRAHEVNLEALAARPFSCVYFSVDQLDNNSSHELDVICEEPCSEGEASVFTTVLFLPSETNNPSEESSHYFALGSCIGTTTTTCSVPSTFPQSTKHKESKFNSLVNTARSVVTITRSPRDRTGFDNPVLQLELAD